MNNSYQENLKKQMDFYGGNKVVQTISKYATHLPMLLSVVARTQGPILEFGLGDYSTPLLHEICKAMNRKLVSIESVDEEWYNKFTRFESEEHNLYFTDDLDSFKLIDNTKWAVVFIDHNADRRPIDTPRVKNNADFVVIHDTETDYATGDFINEFKYYFHYRNLMPWTSVLSNFHSLEFLQGVK